MSSQKLEEIRQKIDLCDDEIVQLLNRRADLVLEVKETKSREQIDTYSPVREQQIFERVKKLAEAGHFPKSAVERIFRSIISATRSLVGELIVSFVGPLGSPAHEAAIRQFGESVNSLVAMSVEDVIRQVASGEAHYGIAAGRSEETGMFSKTMDLIATHGVQIIGELHAPVRSFLSVNEQTEMQYLVVGTRCPGPTGNDKTTVILRLLERAGILREVLQPFSARGVTLLSLESRSSKDRPWEYSFYVDIPGHQSDPEIVSLLEEVKTLCSSFSILGSYPVGSS